MIPLPMNIDLSALGGIDVGSLGSEIKDTIDGLHQAGIRTPIKSLLPSLLRKDKKGKTKGEQLKIDLGLDKYTFVVIQKVFAPVPMYIVTYDSHRPFASINKVRLQKADTTNLYRLKLRGAGFFARKIKMTPPVDIEKVSFNVNSNTIVVVRDLAGEYFKSRTKNKKVIKEEESERKFVLLDYNLVK